MNLHPDFTKLIVDALPDDVRDVLVRSNGALCVAGGFCRDVLTGAEPKDIDIFSKTPQDMKLAIADFDWTEDYTAKRTANSESFVRDNGEGPDVQFITRVYLRDHYNALLTFDFSICQVGVWFDQENGWIGQASEAFLEDLPQFRMRYTAPERDEDPGASLLRMVKFVARGWKISEADIAAVVGRFVAKLDQSIQRPCASLTEDDATNVVKSAFRRVGYAGKAAQPEEDEVPF